MAERLTTQKKIGSQKEMETLGMRSTLWGQQLLEKYGISSGTDLNPEQLVYVSLLAKNSKEPLSAGAIYQIYKLFFANYTSNIKIKIQQRQLLFLQAIFQRFQKGQRETGNTYFRYQTQPQKSQTETKLIESRLLSFITETQKDLLQTLLGAVKELSLSDQISQRDQSFLNQVIQTAGNRSKAEHLPEAIRKLTYLEADTFAVLQNLIHESRENLHPESTRWISRQAINQTFKQVLKQGNDAVPVFCAVLGKLTGEKEAWSFLEKQFYSLEQEKDSFALYRVSEEKTFHREEKHFQLLRIRKEFFRDKQRFPARSAASLAVHLYQNQILRLIMRQGYTLKGEIRPLFHETGRDPASSDQALRLIWLLKTQWNAEQMAGKERLFSDSLLKSDLSFPTEPLFESRSLSAFRDQILKEAILKEKNPEEKKLRERVLREKIRWMPQHLSVSLTPLAIQLYQSQLIPQMTEENLVFALTQLNMRSEKAKLFARPELIFDVWSRLVREKAIELSEQWREILNHRPILPDPPYSALTMQLYQRQLIRQITGKYRTFLTERNKVLKPEISRLFKEHGRFPDTAFTRMILKSDIEVHVESELFSKIDLQVRRESLSGRDWHIAPELLFNIDSYIGSELISNRERYVGSEQFSNQNVHVGPEQLSNRDVHVGLELLSNREMHIGSELRSNRNRYAGSELRSNRDVHIGSELRSNQERYIGPELRSNRNRHIDSELFSNQGRHIGLELFSNQERYIGSELFSDRDMYVGSELLFRRALHVDSESLSDRDRRIALERFSALEVSFPSESTLQSDISFVSNHKQTLSALSRIALARKLYQRWNTRACLNIHSRKVKERSKESSADLWNSIMEEKTFLLNRSHILEQQILPVYEKQTISHYLPPVPATLIDPNTPGRQIRDQILAENRKSERSTEYLKGQPMLEKRQIIQARLIRKSRLPFVSIKREKAALLHLLEAGASSGLEYLFPKFLTEEERQEAKQSILAGYQKKGEHPGADFVFPRPPSGGEQASNTQSSPAVIPYDPRDPFAKYNAYNEALEGHIEKQVEVQSQKELRQIEWINETIKRQEKMVERLAQGQQAVEEELSDRLDDRRISDEVIRQLKKELAREKKRFGIE